MNEFLVSIFGSCLSSFLLVLKYYQESTSGLAISRERFGMILGVMIVSLTIILHKTHKLTPIFLDFSLSELSMKSLPVLHVCGLVSAGISVSSGL